MYRIVCRDPTITDCYIGSTTDFTKRKSSHKSACNNSKDENHHYYLYQFIRDHGGWENWDVLEIEMYRAVDKPDQARRERCWLETYGATLNKAIPSRTEKEYREENREQIRERNKVYREENREQIRENDREKSTCNICNIIYSKSNLSQHKKSKKHQLFLLDVGTDNLLA
jgi:hypothetical protein